MLTLIMLVCIVGAYDTRFFAVHTLLVLVSDTMTLFIMASGCTFVILMGGIDLSLQSVASMTSVILATLLPEYGYLAIPAALAGGLAAGLLSGASHTVLRIPSFIATLAVGGIVATAALIFSQTRSVNIAVGTREAYLHWITGESLGVPNEIFIGLAVLIGLSLVLEMTPFGRFTASIGAAERAVFASGIHVDRIKLVAFAISGLMAGLSGIVMAGRISSGSPTLANEFLLPAIAAVIVGGTALTGGVGSVWRTFIGALIIAVIRIGMTFMGVSVFAQQIVFGLVLIAAVAVTIDRTRVKVVK
ncbi:MAG: ABC transporter permease [Gammaproteobacteria bacterium]